MSIILFLALVGALFWMEYLRRQGKGPMTSWSRSEPVEAMPMPKSESARLQLEPQGDRRAGVDRRRHVERRSADRRRAS